MDLSKIVPVIVQLSIVLVVVSLGLKSNARDVRGALRRPGLLARSLLALNVIVPALVILTVLVFQPVRPVKIALVLLAISPVPPVLPIGQSRLSSDAPYIFGLLVISSLLSIVFVPAAVALLSMIVPGTLVIPFTTVGKIVLLTVLAPLLLGMAVRRWAPELASRLAAPVLKAGLALLLVGLLLIVLGSWRAILGLIGNGTVLVIGVVVALATATGHVLGGPDPEDRVVLALAASMRHPGIALAIAGVNFPGERTVGAAIVLYLLLNAVFSQPYKKWWQQTRPATAQKTELSGVEPERHRRSA